MVDGVRNLIRRRDILLERLKVAKSMRAFISHRMSTTEELRARLEQVESELAATQKAADDGAKALKTAEVKKEATQVEADQLRRPSG